MFAFIVFDLVSQYWPRYWPGRTLSCNSWNFKTCPKMSWN